MAQSVIALGFAAGALEWFETALGATAEQVKASAGTLHLVQVDNSLNGVVSYLKLYFAAVGSVTVGTTAPDIVIGVAANLKLPVPFVGGNAFGTALTAVCVTTGGTAGTTSPTSSVPVTIIIV